MGAILRELLPEYTIGTDMCGSGGATWHIKHQEMRMGQLWVYYEREGHYTWGLRWHCHKLGTDVLDLNDPECFEQLATAIRAATPL